MFEFNDVLRYHLQAYLEDNFSPCVWTIVSNVLQYVAAQGYNFVETADLLESLLDGIGLTRSEIEECLLRN